jgi:zinc transport system substrate-binding protein
MSRTRFSLSFAASLMTGTAMADAPNVAVDIAPIHSLVARVMDGVGAPNLIVPPGATPHEYSLRPSEASALQEAEIVFWIGEGLTPWMEDAVETLAGDADVTSLLEVDGVMLLDFRDGAMFEAHDHDEDHDDDHDHEHDDDHDEEHDHAEEHADADDHDHDHGAHDPHAWLSPENAAAWLDVIAAELSAADPDNAGTYLANAAEARNELEGLSEEVNAVLDPLRDGRFVVFHDAYQYFERAFDFPAAGAISLSDATDPSPARIAEIQARVMNEGIDCVLAEPQFNPGIVATVMEGTDARTAVLDPLGSDLEPGPDLYPRIIRNLADTLAGCL